MIIIGEKLNSSIPKTGEAMKNGDTVYIKQLIDAQVKSGATYLDVNTALCAERERDEMRGIIKEIRAASPETGIVLDSADTSVCGSMWDELDGAKVIINSLTLGSRHEYIDMALEHKCGLIALPIDSAASPSEFSERAQNSARLIEMLLSRGISPENIYLDALVETLAVGDNNPSVTLQTIAFVKKEFPSVRTVCGLSNVSFGLPKRRLLNSAFMSMAVYCGLDAAIIDCTDDMLIDTLRASEAIAGRDEYCMNYIGYIRGDGN